MKDSIKNGIIAGLLGSSVGMIVLSIFSIIFGELNPIHYIITGYLSGVMVTAAINFMKEKP